MGVAYKLVRTFGIIGARCSCVSACLSACLCVYVRRLIVVVVVIGAAGLLMKVCVIKSVHLGLRLRPSSLKLHLIENGTAVMI